MIDLLLPCAAFCALVAFSLGIRLYPFRINPKLGVDNWYWLLCAEDVKRRRRLPARLPYFMLEIEEQWYPPLYAGLLALLPLKLLKEHGGKLSQVIDLLHGLLIFFGVFWVGGNVVLALLAGLSYAVAFFPFYYNTQLQPRGLANLLLTLTVIGIWIYHDARHPVVWIGLLLLSTLLLFLHKMTVQIWVVYLLGFGFWAQDWTIPALLPASIGVALVISRGFYAKMLKAHWDVVSFWHENIRFLCSHQYYESPRYRDEHFVSTAFHQPGLRGWIGKLRSLSGNNVFVVLILVLAYETVFARQLGLEYFWGGQRNLESFLWWWIGLTYLWSFLTAFVPYFTALGAGIYYLYQSFFPLFVLTGLLLRDASVPTRVWLFVFWGLALLLSGYRLREYLVQIATSKADALQDELIQVLNYLKGLPKDGVFCIPFTLPDVTAYWTRKKVFWGGHSYGFHSMLKPFFPVMRADVVQTLKEQPLNYVLFWRGYLKSLKDIGLEEGQHIRRICSRGEYDLYEVIK